MLIVRVDASAENRRAYSPGRWINITVEIDGKHSQGQPGIHVKP